MQLMASFFHRYRWQMLYVLLALLLSGIAEGIGLSAMLPLLNVALDSSSGNPAERNEFEQSVLQVLDYLGIEPTIGPLLLVIVLGASSRSVLLIIAQRKVGYTAAQIGTDMRLEMLQAILRSKWEYFLHQPIGKLTNALATEAQRSSESFVFGATAITFLIQAMIYGAVAVAISWRATLASLVAGLIVIGVSHFLVRIARRAGKKQTMLMSSLMSRLTDTLQSVKPMKAMAKEHLADSVLAMETSRLNKALRRQVFSNALLNSGQDLLFTLFIALGIYMALVIFDMNLATVMVLVVTIGRSFSFLGKVQKQYQKMVQGESAYWSMRDSINAALSAEENLHTGDEPALSRGISFRQVGFNYDQRQVLRDLNLDIPAFRMTTLVGASGAGKTTIVDLIIGLLEPASGAILIDDIPVGQLDTRRWRQTIGYVPQETVLLHDTVLNNITLGDSSISDEEVERALRMAGAWDFIAALPQGVHSMVGERGGKLSGGQRQRIAIARALVSNPQLLILDEATSALDPGSEQDVLATLEGLKGQLTILAVSHTSGMVKAADRVYELNSGKAELREASASQPHPSPSAP